MILMIILNSIRYKGLYLKFNVYILQSNRKTIKILLLTTFLVLILFSFSINWIF